MHVGQRDRHRHRTRGVRLCATVPSTCSNLPSRRSSRDRSGAVASTHSACMLVNRCFMSMSERSTSCESRATGFSSSILVVRNGSGAIIILSGCSSRIARPRSCGSGRRWRMWLPRSICTYGNEPSALASAAAKWQHKRGTTTDGRGAASFRPRPSAASPDLTHRTAGPCYLRSHRLVASDTLRKDCEPCWTTAAAALAMLAAASKALSPARWTTRLPDRSLGSATPSVLDGYSCE